jgi:hypothetical protein
MLERSREKHKSHYVVSGRIITAKDVIWCSHIIQDIQHEENTGATTSLHQGNGIVVCELKFKANYKQALRVAIELAEKRSQGRKLEVCFCVRGAAPHGDVTPMPNWFSA